MNFLKRLFGHKEKPMELPPEFLQENPPDWLIDLKGAELPEGRRFSIRLQLSASSRSGTVEVVALPRNDREELKSADAALDRGEIDRLFVILGFSFPGDIAGIPDEMDAGLPANISIHRREPYSTASAGCNLAGWLESRKPGPPIVEIGKILLEAQRRVLPLS